MNLQVLLLLKQSEPKILYNVYTKKFFLSASSLINLTVAIQLSISI